MKNYLLPFLSIVIGACLVLWLKPTQKSRIKLLLAFSGAFLMGMTIFHLLPEVYHEALHTHEENSDFGDKAIGVWIVVGILLQIVLEFFSHGAEHGHFHSPAKGLQTHFPWGLFISLSIHHLPIAMVLTIFFLDSGIGLKRTLAFLFVFSLMTPLGAFLANYVPALLPYHNLMSAVVVGIFLHISSVILFETSENHQFNYRKLGVIIIGFAMAFLFN